MEEILNYLLNYAILNIAIICLILGYILKHYFKFVKNDYIPLILAIVGAFLNVWLNDWIFSPSIIFAGMASGLVATGGFELIKNLRNTNKETLEKEKLDK